jgi:hypothetical protein
LEGPLLPASQTGETKVMSKRIGIVAVFLVGCAIGGASSQMVVPKASAQQAATLTKWEHVCVHPSGADGLTKAARKHGVEGWELVTVTVSGSGFVQCFKRPKL